jgi:imidazole glycerol-phosphate synthase subunit HisF
MVYMHDKGHLVTLCRRLIVCLDVKDGRVVKGVQFRELRDIGDPASMAAVYEQEGADEVVLLDITASAEDRGTRWEMVRRAAEQVFIPLTVGGGVRDIADMTSALRSGADKVAVNSAAVARPALLTEAAARFGAQCVVASIDAREDARMSSGWRVVTHGGRTDTEHDAVAWASTCAERGAGEILLTSIDRDGKRDGYDIALTHAVADVVDIPVVASGGAGNADHVCAVLDAGSADAALVAGIVHDGVTSVAAIKRAMVRHGLPVRSLAVAASSSRRCPT